MLRTQPLEAPIAKMRLPLPLDTFLPVSWQQTTRAPLICTGIGVHSGKPATLKILPAPPHTGYMFIRTDIAGSASLVPARWDTVADTSMSTTIANASGVSVSTIEHLIAALAGCHIHNAVIETDGVEVPIMDGSSAGFVQMLKEAPPLKQDSALKKIKVLKKVEVKAGASSASLAPWDEFRLDMKFDANGRLANQQWSLTYYPEQDSFEDLLAGARTFGFYEDAQYLWSKGLAQGASLDNTVVIRDGKVMNEEGLRFADEFVRHKMLDAIGDLALAGGQIAGHFSGINSGHALNNQLLRVLFADETAWRYE